MSLNDDWVTEICKEGGSAFSLLSRGKVLDQHSEFQRIEVFDTETYGKLMLIDGCTMLSSRENFLYHEMMTHPALFTHPRPQRVAIIGGGDCGTLCEVLKHSEVEQVTQIDIDEAVTEAALKHFPELCATNNDRRASLLFADGIAWMSEAPAGSLDVIIVDSTDPAGPGEALFSKAFYDACFEALDDGGLVVQQSESPLIHLPVLERMYRDFIAAEFSDVRTLFFPQPIYPTGWWSATMAAKGAGLKYFRVDDVRGREFVTNYYNESIHIAAFAEPEFFRKERERWFDDME